MWWFIKTSKQYVSPRGFFAWTRFIFDLPKAYWKYCEAMRESSDDRRTLFLRIMVKN